ncbi:solute carrier organic anion transporter family member 2A1-like [Pomacea canaliculata]|nr:solute carrier organic anion transporter family member 2A1-like [Pomacea canaliculata]
MEKDDLQDLQTNHSDDKRTEDHHGNEEYAVCGAGSCRPSFMQRCARIGCFTLLVSLITLTTSTLNTYLSSQVTTLERQFGLSSSISGMILSCNELGYLLTILPFSHLARRLHVPRALAVTTLVFGLAGLVCTIPFLASRNSLLAVTWSLKDLNASQSDVSSSYIVPLCADDSLERSRDDNLSLTSNMSYGRDSCIAEHSRKKAAVSEDWKGLAVAFLTIGMILQGCAKSPRTVFTGVYIDDNGLKTESSLHIGIVGCITIFGPVLAFVLGGVFTRLYITLEDTGLSPLDPRWIGAWWLGFLVFGITSIVTALPLVFFPRRLRPQPHLAALKEERKRAAKGRQCTYGIIEFLRSVMRVLMTPVYTLVVLGLCCQVLGQTGLFAFLPKYLETQFFLPTWKANVTIGLVNLLAMSLGTLIGGYVTSRFKFTPMTCLKVMVILNAVWTCLSVSGFVLGCDQPHIDTGVTSHSVMNTTQRCQSSCQCDDSRYFPTCGADGVTYFSPCHAGCSETRGTFYGNCSCIEMPKKTSQPVPEAVPGLCAQSCTTFYPYVAISFFSELLGAMSILPCFIVVIRSVAEVDKPLAIGLYSFLYTLLGWFPAPVLYGQVVDTTCLLWSSGCAGRGSCSLYDLRAFRHRMFGTFFTTRVVYLVFLVIALVVASRMKKPFFAHCDVEPEVSTVPKDEKAMLTKNMTTVEVVNKK